MMEALSPMGETVMETSSVLPSPQSSNLMLGVGEESMETMTMSPKAPETQETNNERLQQIPAPVLSTDGTLHSLNTPFAGSLSNLMLPGIPNAAAATTSFFLNATSPTTVAAPFLLNQSSLTTATAGAPQFLMNGSPGVHPNTTFLLNTNPGNSNMQTFLLNPNMAAQGTPLMVQTPQTNTAFLVNPGVLNTSANTLLLTHPGLAGSNGALMLAANQGAAALPQVQPQLQQQVQPQFQQQVQPLLQAQVQQQVQPAMTPALVENTMDASSSEVQAQQQTAASDTSSTLQLQTLQLPIGTLPGALIQTDGAQNVILQPRMDPAESDTSSISELSQGVVEENSITENIRENKDSKYMFLSCFYFVFVLFDSVLTFLSIQLYPY
nr:uncharacterized protein LOC129269848 isoform X1 [Lytechinus pictus]